MKGMNQILVGKRNYMKNMILTFEHEDNFQMMYLSQAPLSVKKFGSDSKGRLYNSFIYNAIPGRHSL